MNGINWKARLTAAVFCSVSAMAAYALPNVNSGQQRRVQPQLKTTAQNCAPAQAAVDLDINNVRARLMTGGDMWWDLVGEPRYEVPKGSKKNALFAGSLWIGGYDPQGTLKVAAQTYRQNGNDYWPGPVNSLSHQVNDIQTTDAATCSEWDRFWKVNRSDINTFKELSAAGAAPSGSAYTSIYEWPALGNQRAIGANQGSLLEFLDRPMAPFVDKDGDGVYDASKGDYPDILGQQFVWWVFNDGGNLKTETATPSIGFEVQTAAFAFSTNDFLNDATFYRYTMVNRGPQQLDSCFMATWTDADLGDPYDDYIGCDTARGLGVLYNAKTVDGSGQINSYGNKIPQVGVDFFIGPGKKIHDPVTGKDTTIRLKMKVFNYFTNDFTSNGNPNNGVEIYNYITGTNRTGQPLHYDYAGPGIQSNGRGPGPAVTFVFDGDPSDKNGWSECACNNTPYDRRFIHSAGPFVLEAGGAVNEVTIGAIWVADAGGCPTTSFSKIFAADDQAQDLFDNNFKEIKGPEAPRLVIREMDKKLICYLVNDSNSNNFGERFGLDSVYPGYNRTTSKARHFTDSLYKFEGYRVFQLRNATITSAQVFNEKGEVDANNAVEVFQRDVKNNVSTVIAYQNKRDIGPNVYEPAVKVTGSNSGIDHSFEITQDQFGNGNNKDLVNFKTYYFIAVAYAYNNFTQFDPADPDSTQDVTYLGSSSGANDRPLVPVAAMPNPQGAGYGSVLNADYGVGVIIKRLEGTGNGGVALQMNQESEMQAITGPDYAVANPVYEPRQGPVDVFVIDPVRVKPLNWELYIQGPTYFDSTHLAADTSRGIIGSAGTWTLKASDGTEIMSERSIGFINEQILENYGIAVKVVQQLRPLDADTLNNNGYITSDITFADPNYNWMGGVQDKELRSNQNWIRSGKNNDISDAPPPPCDYDDYFVDNSKPPVGQQPSPNTGLDSMQAFENMLATNTLAKGTWAPYALAAVENKSTCGFGVAYAKGTAAQLYNLQSVDVVLTSDRTKWSRSPVVEMQDEPALSQGGAKKHRLRRHAGWDGSVDGSGNPVYSSAPEDSGMSMFPGYAINQENGQRLNIVFSEDSYQANDNGRDLIWNPTSNLEDLVSGQVINGGKHYIFVSNTKYDGGDSLRTLIKAGDAASGSFKLGAAYKTFQWVGLPLLVRGLKLLSIRDGIIPNETRVRMRVTRPYASFIPDPAQALKNNGFPLYSFSTQGLAYTRYSDVINPNKDSILNNIRVVPNPYYAYNGYEGSRLDTRVRITNLPNNSVVDVYTVDGSLVRRLTKDNAGVSFVDWDIRNSKGLPIASGMYLIHVNAPGFGETVIKWFGAMRPVDIVTY